MGKRIIFLPPDNASLMRYIYLKLCISSPCQSLQAGPRVPLLVCFGSASVGLAGSRCHWSSRCLPSHSPDHCIMCPFLSHHPDLSTAFGLLCSPSHPPHLPPGSAHSYHLPGPQPTAHVHVQRWPLSSLFLLPQT